MRLYGEIIPEGLSLRTGAQTMLYLAPVRRDNPRGDYLSVQAHKPCSISPKEDETAMIMDPYNRIQSRSKTPNREGNDENGWHKKQTGQEKS